MTFVRRCALKISGSMVRYASAGCKPWAEALAREAELIQSDWVALWWAIGSLRVAMIRRVGSAGARTHFSRSPLWYMWPIAEISQVFANSIATYKAPTWHDRIAAGLLVFGWAVWTTMTLAGLLQGNNEPPISNIQAYRVFTRAKLERRLKRYSSPMRWLPLVVPLSMGTGYVMIDNLPTWLVAAVALLGICALCLDTPAKIQTRLDRLNDRIAETASERHA